MKLELDEMVAQNLRQSLMNYFEYGDELSEVGLEALRDLYDILDDELEG